MTGSRMAPRRTEIGAVVVFFILLSSSLLQASTSIPNVINLEKSKSNIEFLAIGNPSAIKIRGKARGEKPAINGNLRLEGTVLSGSAVMLLDEFDTGMELRNKHMKEKYLETQKWPTSELVFTKMSLPETCLNGECESTNILFEGTLSLHGIKKAVSGLATFKKRQNAVEANFNFKFPLSDFGIEIPSFMGVSVTQDVAVNVEVAGLLTGQ